jgi:hypothetical protein
LLSADNVYFRWIHAFLEVDMGTESHERFAAKIRRYLAYKESRLFRIRYGGRAFRVLIVAPTDARVGALKRAAERVGAERSFWFINLPDLLASGLEGAGWRVNGIPEERVTLFATGPQSRGQI